MSLQYYLHKDKIAVKLTGDKPADFLNDLLTAQIAELPTGITRAACLLSPQGRILFDMLVVQQEGAVYLVTEKAQAEALIKRLSLYRLRRAINITLMPEINICHLADLESHQAANTHTLPSSAITAIDERHDNLGLLCLIPETDLPATMQDIDWQIQRISSGIPEGALDLTPNRALMLEAGLQQLAAVDFKKGCYIGQEVTARTHYRGLVKRRLFPISTHKTALTHGSDILLADRIVGKLGSVAHKDDKAVGLASLRLNAVQQCLDHQKKNGNALLSLEDGTRLFLNIPSWMHPLPGFDTAED
jgi:folate-binding protein YgfZ